MPLKGNNLLFARSSKRSTSSRVIDGSFLSWTHISKKLIFPLMASLSLWLDIRCFSLLARQSIRLYFLIKIIKFIFWKFLLFFAPRQKLLLFSFLPKQSRVGHRRLSFHFLFLLFFFLLIDREIKSESDPLG